MRRKTVSSDLARLRLYSSKYDMLWNEKYIGDGLRQKIYTLDCISKKVKKNEGELPQYYVENNHPAIVPKDIFLRVKEEMTRRASKRKVMQKTGKTEPPGSDRGSRKGRGTAGPPGLPAEGDGEMAEGTGPVLHGIRRCHHPQVYRNDYGCGC